MNPSHSTIPYRPAIDGLRAIAVLAVMFFHLDERAIPGGFVGVDVFFVISGFLITSIIYRGCESGRFRLTRFYQRRIARIFPPAFAVTLAIVLAASYVYSSQDFASTGALSIASALSVTNLKLMLQGNYFETSSDAQPFLHFWSLAIEEQFYLCLPIFMVAASRLNFSRKTLLMTLWTIAIGSFLGCVYLTNVRPTWSFYLLPTRAWELLAGAILAVSAAGRSREPANARSAWGRVIGLAMIIASIFVIDGETSFPGYAAMLPVLGTVLLIGRGSAEGQLTERWLANPVLVTIGRLSYSFYLWHWPIYSMVDYQYYAESAPTRILMKVLLTVVFSVLSYRWIENPVRTMLNRTEKKRLAFASFIVGIAIIIPIGLVIRSSNYIDSRYASVSAGGVSIQADEKAPHIVLIGDSHGSMYGKMFSDLSKDMGYNANIISVTAGDPMPPSEQYQQSLEFLEKAQPDVSIFVAEWHAKLNPSDSRVQQVASDLSQCSSHLVFITQPPYVPWSAMRDTIRRDGLVEVREPETVSKERHAVNAQIKQLAGGNVHVLDVEDLFVREDGTVRFRNAAGRTLFHDLKHLSDEGAAEVRDRLASLLRELVD